MEYYIETATDDDGALGVDDEFDIYEDLQLDVVSLKSSDKSGGESTSEDHEEGISDSPIADSQPESEGLLNHTDRSRLFDLLWGRFEI